MTKKKSSAKNSKKQETKIDEPVILTNEQKQETINKLNKLKGSEVMILPDEAIVNIPISGSFNKAIEGLFFHLMHPLNASQIIHTMDMIKRNFEGIDEEKINDNDRALWCVLTLLSEIHWQADAQGKMKKTEASVGNAIHALLHGVDGATEQIATGMQVAKAQAKAALDKGKPPPAESSNNPLEKKSTED